MNYIEYMNSFNLWLESNALPASSQLMYFKLLNVFNRAGWAKYVQVDTRRLMYMIDAETEKTAIRVRDRLVEADLIGYIKGKKGCPNRYYLKKINVYDYYPPIVDTTGNTVGNTVGNTGMDDSENNCTVGNTVTNTVTNTVGNTVGNTVTNDSHIRQEKDKEKDNITPKPPTAKKILESLLPGYAFADGLSAKIGDWVQYKQERKEGYKEQGLKSLLTQIQKNALKYGDAAVIDLIDLSMSNGWKGIIWDKLAEPQRPVYAKKPEIPKGCGELGEAELEAIQRVLQGD